ncbi:MAG: recombinase family protein, partial [Ramlibacter sp.]|nr:recombinase family protein [Ramlibacter sp.]
MVCLSMALDALAGAVKTCGAAPTVRPQKNIARPHRSAYAIRLHLGTIALHNSHTMPLESDFDLPALLGTLRPRLHRYCARMTRSMLDLEALILLAEAKGVGIATATGDIDLTTDVGRMVARILAAVARAEGGRKAA